MKQFVIIIIIIILSISYNLQAQTDSEVAFIKLNENIGYVIDSIENDHCNCIPYVNKKEFRHGVVVQQPDSFLILKIKLAGREALRNVHLTPISYERLLNSAKKNSNSLPSHYNKEQEIAILKQIAKDKPYLLHDYNEVYFPSYLGNKEMVTIQTDTTKLYIIELYDNTRFIGQIIETNSSTIFIKTSSLPKIEIPKSKIKKMVAIEDENLVDGEYWFPNPNATRYLFGPTAFTLKEGEGYYQNTYLLLNSFNFGVSDYVTLGGGFEIISTFAASDPIFFITPKVGFNISEKWNGAGGILYASVPFNDRESLGILYGITTYGNIEHNVTGGMGWGFVEGELESKPIITFSGMTRVGEKTGLVSENWFIPFSGGYEGIFSYGIRFFGEKISVDLAFLNNADIAQDIPIGIPYVDFVVKF